MNNEVVLIFGRKRTGKTRFMLYWLEQHKRVIYLDPKGGEYAFGVECRTAEAVRDLTEKGTAFRVRIPTPSEYWVTWLCNQALKVSRDDAPVTVAFDEMNYFSKTHGSNPGVYELLKKGGWKGVNVIGCVHRPTDIEVDVLQAADRLIIFQTHYSGDIKRLQHYVDIPDDVFMALKQDEYIEWCVDWGRRYEVRQRYDDKPRGNRTDKQRNESDPSSDSEGNESQSGGAHSEGPLPENDEGAV